MPTLHPRLLFVITEDWFFASHFLDRASAAVRAGFEVAVATRRRQKAGAIEAAGIRVIPVEFCRRGLNPVRELRTALGVRRAVRDFRPDIVHNVALKPVVTGTLGALLGGAPRIVNAPVGMGYVFTANGGTAAWMRPAMRLLLRALLCPAAGRVVIENQDDLRDLEASGLARPGSIRLIRGAGVDTVAFAPRPEPPGPVTVVMVARLLRDKGVAEFVEAARLVRAQLPGTRFVLAGDPDPGNPTSLGEHELRALAAQGHVEFLGFREDIADLLASCHVACLPSYREGLPKSLLEAAAAGRPIVATDVPGCREAVAHGVNGILVPARDAAALAEAIGTLVRDGALRRSLGASGRLRAEREFSNEVVVTQTLELYREMLPR